MSLQLLAHNLSGRLLSCFRNSELVHNERMKNVRRGFSPEDEKLFSEEELRKISLCAYETAFLLERGYPLKSAVTYTSNHRLLAERQRNALARMTACPYRLKLRQQKQLDHLDPGCTVNIDAFNAVVIMETALSHSILLRCMDGCIRDLSGLSGTYSIISATDEAIARILNKLKKEQAASAVFWIDEPVSNSGRLREHLAAGAEALSFPAEFRMVHDADYALKKLDHVISGDSQVIEECISWYNLYQDLIADMPDPWIAELSPR